MFKTATLFFGISVLTLTSFGQKEPKEGRLANSIAAIAEDKIITVEEVRRELQPYLPQIQADSNGDPMKFRKLIEEMETEIIQNLTDNVLIVKQFYEDKGQIPPSFVDNEIEEMIITKFEGKRSLYLDYLKSIGKTPEEHRVMIKEDIIVNYMRSNMRKSATIVSPVRIEEFYKEYKQEFFQPEALHLRLIRLTKLADEGDEVLEQTADEILEKLEMGFAFDELAARYSNDAKAKKGGDWGWVTRGALIDELAQVAFSLKEGEYSEPLKIKNNLFILYCEEYRPEGYMPLQDVREDIEDILVSQMAREAEAKFLERLRRDGYVRRFN
ncbi:peptidylprolyl isomerase [Pelagicoccus sp. SDUM812003]|uniref:peptidylprolyl isomerase n=1 Tax=Pelagicoccus sp. SDUM812003 TaxID=3041267 RepID=UPI00280EA8D8|nr:peptidylprolyl isomerase [Pelagicoccus sp. SDUM812003]MDQ8205309.1 peptidylprolyl isomerase [Pelagicoccus sp. SDUM812003]